MNSENSSLKEQLNVQVVRNILQVLCHPTTSCVTQIKPKITKQLMQYSERGLRKYILKDLCFGNFY